MKYIIFLYLTSFSISAQIRGVVKDSLSGEPIPFVNIWVKNENIATTSEIDGSFFLETKPEKKIIFSILGFEKKIIKASQVSNVFLKQATFDFKEIIILKKKKTKKN